MSAGGRARNAVRQGREAAALAGAVALAVFLALSATSAAVVSWERLRGLARHARETEPEARARLSDPQYVAAVERIKALVPENEPLYVVDTAPGNHSYFLRYDLAPRPMILLGTLPSLDQRMWRDTEKLGVRRAVVDWTTAPWPQLLPVEELAASRR